MAKEHKCRKCGLTYKGFSSTCPYCHKKTKHGIVNAIMCVIGYLTTFFIAACIIWYELTMLFMYSFALLPLIVIIAVVALVVLLIALLIK